MKKPSFLLALLFAAAPALAQSPDGWLRERDMLLGPARNHLMGICGDARKYNQQRRSSFFSDIAPGVYQQMRGSGYSLEMVRDLSAGAAAAMAVACPDVW
jgi:hypothetical protein